MEMIEMQATASQKLNEQVVNNPYFQRKKGETRMKDRDVDAEQDDLETDFD